MAGPDSTKRDLLTALAPSRQEVYSFLASAFSEPPSPETLSAVGDPDFLASASEMFGDDVIAPLREHVRGETDCAEMERDARQEFMNLFKVPGGQYVTPYESVFRDAREVAGQPVKGLLMGQSAIDVQAWYRLGAVDISEEYGDLPDHIALELAYLSYLCVKEAEFASVSDEARLMRALEMQRDFLAGHVARWIGPLCDKIRKKTRHPYFLTLADLAVQFVRRELATLEDVLGPSCGKQLPEYEELAS